MKFPLILMDPLDEKYDAKLKRVNYILRALDILVTSTVLVYIIFKEIVVFDTFDAKNYRITDLIKNGIFIFSTSILLASVYVIRKQILDARNADFLLQVRMKQLIIHTIAIFFILLFVVATSICLELGVYAKAQRGKDSNVYSRYECRILVSLYNFIALAQISFVLMLMFFIYVSVKLSMPMEDLWKEFCDL